MKRHRMIKVGDRKVPLIEKEIPEVSCHEVSSLIAKHGAVMIRDPRWEETVREINKRKKVL